MEAAISAAPTRIRAIYLTTITTFLGLIPTAYGIGGSDPFLVPMAITLSWGLVFGTVITLYATPILYVAFADLRLIMFSRYQEVLKPEKEPTLEQIEGVMEETIKRDLMSEIHTEIHSDLRKEIRTIAREELKKELGKMKKK
jgi:hypothetical protein